MRRQRDPEGAWCSRCWAALTEPWEVGERYCGGCQEALLCQDEAHEIGEFHGLYLKWTEVRDLGRMGALEAARNRARGVDPDTKAAEAERLAAGDWGL